MLFSFKASQTGAGKISSCQQPERPSKGTSRTKSVQEQKPGPEEEAQHDVQQEWKQKMGTEEGCKELGDTTERKRDHAPSVKGGMYTKGDFPGGTFSGQATGYRNERPSRP